jgi:hypothetical protein
VYSARPGACAGTRRGAMSLFADAADRRLRYERTSASDEN